MKVELTRKIKEVLQDPSARRQLQQALADGKNQEISVGNKRYELVSLSEADPRAAASQ
ncbi:MAG: hypothetical protein ACK5N0_15710 [Synechococcaceae cyanobacterium]